MESFTIIMVPKYMEAWFRESCISANCIISKISISQENSSLIDITIQSKNLANIGFMRHLYLTYKNGIDTLNRCAKD